MVVYQHNSSSHLHLRADLTARKKEKKKKPLAQAFLSLYYILLSIIPVIYEENESKDAEEEGRYTLI